jgi:hypothetical protein
MAMAHNLRKMVQKQHFKALSRPVFSSQSPLRNLFIRNWSLMGTIHRAA